MAGIMESPTMGDQEESSGRDESLIILAVSLKSIVGGIGVIQGKQSCPDLGETLKNEAKQEGYHSPNLPTSKK